MSVSYKKLFDLLENKGLKKYDLRKQGIHSVAIEKLKANKNVDVSTITKLCALLDCQPGDIMEYILYTQGANGTITVKIPPDILADEEKKELSKE